MFNNKIKANWNEIHNTVVNGVKYSFYFSDGGAFKITQHTGEGEKQVFMGPGQALRVISELAPENELFLSLVETLDSVKDDIVKAKENRRLEMRRMKEAERALLTIQAQGEILERMGFKITKVS